ncbi:MAG: hypothetical protein CO094_02585 [Anaerolineae bacterium CG_4_9_14_3_um_filter_57_17]|nr:zinc ribbon domain-containing protein [bacterium]NCT20202.1 zinc ribbon domain-containing protein [bacterium]OIO86965.1 MAG: hypothetical protein AUK01_01490 [Anaerolineae bacterium CG2_30_57_67]PJB67928.1 MAG: hypothetical protein CO094_02585 [Anaerolineae bacterium CG_4_9_14_3_um_filter_57_17]
MKNTWKWILGIVLVLVLFFGLYLFQLVFPTVGYGYGMMGGFGFFPFGMGLMWIVPLGTIVLVAFGIVWLVNNLNGTKTVQGRVCPSCEKPAQADWKTCPYCGNGL